MRLSNLYPIARKTCFDLVQTISSAFPNENMGNSYIRLTVPPRPMTCIFHNGASQHGNLDEL